MMEKRTRPRIDVNVTASVQRLGICAGGNGRAIAVQVVDASERGMRLRSPEALDAGQAVKIEMGDAMFLGEICYCASVSGRADYFLGVVTEECLTGLNSLQHLIQALQPKGIREREPSR